MRPLPLIALGFLALAAAACDEPRESTWTAPDGTRVEYSGDEDRPEVTLRTPEGEIQMGGDANLASFAESGLEVYPGAEAADGDSSSFRTKTPEMTQWVLHVVTKDKVEKVLDFYRGAIEVEAELSSGGMSMLSGTTPTGRKVNVVANPTDDGRTEVSVTVLEEREP